MPGRLVWETVAKEVAPRLLPQHLGDDVH
jgi:hypothetical protein